jgi:hypothetical protein
MRSTLPVCLLVTATAALSLPVPAAAQPEPPLKYVRVEFMKVVEGKQADYPKLEEAWKAVHEDRLRKGHIESWSQYVVRLPPSSTSREYDAVTMHVYPSFAKIGEPYDEEQMARIATFPPAGDIRKMVRSEIWALYRTAGDLLSSKYATVLFHKAKPGQLGAYLDAQKEHYLPINQELVKSGVRKSWHSFGVWYPSGTANTYDWVTYDGYEAFDAPAGNTTAGIAPERVAAASRAVSAHRDTVRNEYWQLVRRVPPQ